MTKPHHSTIAATERDKDRERQRRRRAEMRASKKPSTHTINRAIVEALMQCIEMNRQDGVHRMLTPATLNQVLPRAMAILTLGSSAASSYDINEVHRVMRERAAKRPETWLTDRVTARMKHDDITPSP